MSWEGVVALLTVAAGQAGCTRPLSVPDAAAMSPAPPALAVAGAVQAGAEPQ
jgi:hypothetical protein